MDNKKLIEALNNRYATKIYDSTKKISKDDLDTLLESARLAPSSFGLEPVKFLVIENKDLRTKLKAAAWGQPQLSDASNIIVICARKDIDDNYIKKFVERTAKVRNIPKEQLAGFEEMLLGFRTGKTKEWTSEWTKKQSYIALGFLLESAAIMGIDATPMEGFDSVKFDEILNIKNSDYTSVTICALGYRSKEDKYAALKKVRFDKKDIIEFR